MEKHLLIAAGYGGHSGYAYAVANSLLRKGFRRNIILIAEGYEFLVEKFRGYGDIYTLVLPRRPGEGLLRTLPRWIRAFAESGRVISYREIGAVFASGSNFSIPPGITGLLMRGSALFTIEAIEHFTTRSRSVGLLEKIGARVFLHWEEQLELFPRGIVVGPVYEPPIYDSRDEGYVLVTTGTLGHPSLFSAIDKLGLDKVVMQTGDVDPSPYQKKRPSWVLFRYTSDIHKWISGASLVITQQGVTAAISALAYRKPTIIVWNPRVVLGAELQEVEMYAERIGAMFLKKPDVASLRKAIELAERPKTVTRNGSEKIANILIRELS